MHHHSHKKVLVPAADGAEEIETVSIVDTLRRAEVNVILASANRKQAGIPIIKGSRGISIVCDSYLEDVLEDSYDAIALPGGMKNAETLAACAPLIAKLHEQKKAHKWYAAICASPALVFEPNGLLDGEVGTCYPSLAEKLSKQDKIHERVVVSNKCITSQGPGTAIDFALVLIEKLVSTEKAAQVAKGLLTHLPK